MGGQIATFGWSRYVGAVAFAALIGGVLGFVMSILVELVIGRRLPEKIKSAVVFIGALVGYATVKAFLNPK